MSRAIAFAVAVLLTGAVEPSAADGPFALTIDEGSFAGELIDISAKGVVSLRQQGATKQLSLEDLVTWGAPVEARSGPQLVLGDGGLLVAHPVKIDGDHLLVESGGFEPLLGEFQIPLSWLAGIVFHPPADPVRRDAMFDRVRASAGKTDRLLLDNGDELSGTLLAVDAQCVELQTAKSKIKLEISRIAALICNPSLLSRPATQGLRTIIGFDDGSRVVASSLSIVEGRVKLRFADIELTPRAARVVFLQPLGGRAAYLSDRKPASYRHLPFLELSWPYHLDRNCTGGWLRAANQLYLKGIGMHSTSRLTFALDGKARRFAAELALDAQTAGRGSAVYRVFADNQQLYVSSPIRGDMAPVPVEVQLPADAKTLSLIVDFGERGDEFDHANWLSARLHE